MAKKGQTFKKHSKGTKEEILRKYFEENIPARVLGKEDGIQMPMSRKDTPSEDSPIESFHSTLKKKFCVRIISHLLKNICCLLKIGWFFTILQE